MRFAGNREEFAQTLILQESDGPNCSIRVLDLGIALGSAAKIAQK